jgi:hypothetical protein
MIKCRTFAVYVTLRKVSDVLDGMTDFGWCTVYRMSAFPRNGLKILHINHTMCAFTM